MKKLKVSILVLLILIFSVNSSAYIINEKSYYIDNNLMDQISRKVPNYTKIDDMPKNLKNAIIAVEDKRFYNHKGYDTIAILRAFIVNIKEGKIKEGASTITQQLAKNLFLSSKKKLRRKIDELILSIRLEKQYSKDEILEMYLNVIYYGEGVYGIENASRKFFNKDVRELSLSECAMLAGLPQAPNEYDPINNYEKAKKRQQQVINAMEKNGFIDKNACENVKKQAILIAK